MHTSYTLILTSRKKLSQAKEWVCDFVCFVSKYTQDTFLSRFKENVPHPHTEREKRTVVWHWRRQNLIQNRETLYGELNCHLTTFLQCSQRSSCLLFIWVDLLKSVLHADLIVPSSKTLVTPLQTFHWMKYYDIIK